MFKKLLYIFDRKQKQDLVILFILMLGGAFVELLGVSSVMPLVEVVTDPEIIHTNETYAAIAKMFSITDAKQFILFIAISLIILYVFKNIYVIIENDLQYRFTYNNQKKLSTRMLDCYLYEDYLDHINKNVADLQRNITTDIINFYYAVIRIIQFMMEFLVCVVLFLYLLIKDFASTMIITGILIVIAAVFVVLYRKASVKNGAEDRRTTGLINKWIMEAMGALKEVKVANAEEYFKKNYNAVYEEYAEVRRRQSMLEVLPKPIMETSAICGLMVAVIVKVLSGDDLAQFIPVLSVFVVAAFRLMPSFNRLTAYSSGILFGKPFIDSVYQDVKRFNEQTRREEVSSSEPGQFQLDSDIEIRDIRFKYPESDKYILDGVSLSIPHQNTVALIGESGAGKSTLANVILGLLKPESGEIDVSNVNVLDHIREWHSCLGYIPQTIFLLDSTIRKNVAFAVPDEEIDEDKVIKALEEAQLYEYVKTLPDGLDTIVGEGGVKLSGGQRQRVGIARALYSDPKLLILDEATSALDNETEAAVMQSIDNLRGEHTMVIIAHRLTTIKNSDRIYEIADGKIKEREKSEVFPDAVLV